MSRPKTNKFKTEMLSDEIALGIDLFMFRHGFKTDYQCGKACDLNDNALNNIRNTGGISAITLYKLGCGVGYDLEHKTSIGIMLRTLKDFEVK